MSSSIVVVIYPVCNIHIKSSSTHLVENYNLIYQVSVLTAIILLSICPHHYRFQATASFLNIRTPKKFVVITLKFELCGSTIE